MATDLHIQEVLKGLDLTSPLEKIPNGALTDAINVGYKSNIRRGGDLVPSVGMTMYNSVFRTYAGDMSDRFVRFSREAHFLLSYDFGHITAVIADVMEEIFLYIIEARKSSDPEDMIAYEVLEYMKIEKPITSDTCLTGVINDGIPSLYITIPKDGIYMVILNKKVEGALVDIQHPHVHLKPSVLRMLPRSYSYIPAGLTSYFFRVIKRDPYETTVLATSGFSELYHVPMTYMDNDLIPINYVWKPKDWLPVSLSRKSKVCVEVMIPDIAIMNAPVDLSVGTHIQLFAMRFFTAVGMTVNEKEPYAKVELVAEASSNYGSETQLKLIDGEIPYILPEDVHLEDLRQDARFDTLFDAAKTILAKDGVFYAANVSSKETVNPVTYDARIWQWNNTNTVVTISNDEYTAETLYAMPFNKTYGLNYTQTSLESYWWDFSEMLMQSPHDYCMYAKATDADPTHYYGASGRNVTVRFVRGDLDAGGVYPEVVPNSSLTGSPQDEQLHSTGVQPTMTDPGKGFSAIARYINAPNLDVGGKRGSEHWYNACSDPYTGILKKDRIQMTVPDTTVSYDVQVSGGQIHSFADPMIASGFKCMQHDSVYWLACKFEYTDGSLSEVIPMGAVRTPSANTKQFPFFEDHVRCSEDAEFNHVVSYETTDGLVTRQKSYEMSVHTEVRFHPIYMEVNFENLPDNVRNVHVMYQLRGIEHRNVKSMGVYYQAHQPISYKQLSTITTTYGEINPGGHFKYKGEDYIKGRTDEELGITHTVTVQLDGLTQKFYDEGGKYCLTPLPSLLDQQYFYGGTISTAATDWWNCQGKVAGKQRKTKWNKDRQSEAYSAALISTSCINAPCERDISTGLYNWGDKSGEHGSGMSMYVGRIVQTNATSEGEPLWVFNSPEIDITTADGSSILGFNPGMVQSAMCVHGILYSVFPAGDDRQLLSAAYSEMNDTFSDFISPDVWNDYSNPRQEHKREDFVSSFYRMWPQDRKSGSSFPSSVYDSLYLCTNYTRKTENAFFTGDDDVSKFCGIGSVLQCNYANPLLGKNEPAGLKTRRGHWTEADSVVTGASIGAVAGGAAVVGAKLGAAAGSAVFPVVGTVVGAVVGAVVLGGLAWGIDHLHYEKIRPRSHDRLVTPSDFQDRYFAIPPSHSSYIEIDRNQYLAYEAANAIIPPDDEEERVQVPIKEVTAFQQYIREVWGLGIDNELVDWVDSKLKEGYQGRSSAILPLEEGLPPRALKFFIYSDQITVRLTTGDRTSRIPYGTSSNVMPMNGEIVDFGGYDRIAHDDVRNQYGYPWPCSTAQMSFDDTVIPKCSYDVTNIGDLSFVNICPLWSGKSTYGSATHKELPSSLIYAGSDRCRTHGMSIGNVSTHRAHFHQDDLLWPIPAATKDFMLTPFSDFGLTVDIEAQGNFSSRTLLSYYKQAYSSSSWYALCYHSTIEEDTVQARLDLPDISTMVFPDVTFTNVERIAASYVGTVYMDTVANAANDAGKAGRPADAFWDTHSFPFYKLMRGDVWGQANYDQTEFHNWNGYNTVDLWCGVNHSGFGGRAFVFKTDRPANPGIHFPVYMLRNADGIRSTTDDNIAEGLFINRTHINTRTELNDMSAIKMSDARTDNAPNPIHRKLQPELFARALDMGTSVALASMRCPAVGYKTEVFAQKKFVTAGVLAVDNAHVAKGTVHNFDTFCGVYKRLYTHAFYPSPQFEEGASPSSPTIMMFPYEGPINVDYMNCIDDLLKGGEQDTKNKRMHLYMGTIFEGNGMGFAGYKQQTDMYGYNMAFTANMQWEKNKFIDDTNVKQNTNRVYWTDFDADGYSIRNFNPDNYLEFDSSYGGINNLHSHGQNVMVFQDRGVAITTPKLPVVTVGTQGEDGDAQTSFVSPVRNENDGNSKDVFTGRYSYVSMKLGNQCHNHDSVLTTSNMAYWVDKLTRQFCVYSGGKVESTALISPWITLTGGSSYSFTPIEDNQFILTARGVGITFDRVLDPFITEANRNTLLYDEDVMTFASFLTLSEGNAIVSNLSGLVITLTDSWPYPSVLREKHGAFFPYRVLDIGSYITSFVNIPEKAVLDKNFYSVFVLNKNKYDRDRVLRVITPEIVGLDFAGIGLRRAAQVYHYGYLSSTPDLDSAIPKDAWEEDFVREFPNLTREVGNSEMDRVILGVGYSSDSRITFSIPQVSEDETDIFTKGSVSGIGIYVQHSYQTQATLSKDATGRVVRKLIDPKRRFPGFTFVDREKAYFSPFGVMYELRDNI